jgi:ABC-type lipopolysaccharide export system ATPase subunit
MEVAGQVLLGLLPALLVKQDVPQAPLVVVDLMRHLRAHLAKMSLGLLRVDHSFQSLLALFDRITLLNDVV